MSLRFAAPFLRAAFRLPVTLPELLRVQSFFALFRFFRRANSVLIKLIFHKAS